MARKVIIMIGVPGTGKTSCCWELIKRLEEKNNSEFSFTDEDLVTIHKLNNIEIIGNYNDPSNVFSGSDRMSMACMPKVKEYLTKNLPEIVFTEGDRLGSNSFIDHCIDLGYETKIIHLTAPKEILEERYKERGSNQPEQFIKAKYTKVNNITTRMDLILDDAIIDIDTSTKTPKEIVDEIIDLFNA